MREALIAGEVRVPIDSDTDIVVARQNGRELAGWCGFPTTDRVLVSTAISELARNIVRYATSGEIILRLVDDGGKRGVEVLAADTGPGVLDVTLAVRDGFSTARSLGLGLPGVRRIMDEFEISSEWGRGTTVTTRKWMWAGWGPLELDDWLSRFGQAWATGISRISALGRGSATLTPASDQAGSPADARPRTTLRSRPPVARTLFPPYGIMIRFERTEISANDTLTSRDPAFEPHPGGAQAVVAQGPRPRRPQLHAPQESDARVEPPLGLRGGAASLETVLDARPDILNHNTETVERLYKAARHGGRYARALGLFRHARAVAPEIPTKSGIILGLGEERDELVATLRDLRAVGVSILTLGQYLRPSPQHLPVSRYYHPDEFAELAGIGRELGFTHVEAGPLVRSSYHAKRQADAAASGGTNSAMANGAGSHPLARPPPRRPAPRTPDGMRSAQGNGAGSHLVAGHPPMAPASRTPLQ